MTCPHAVRWARRELKRAMTMDYTRWHRTTDGRFTACGRPIPIAFDGGTFLPETEEDVGRVTCQACLRKAGK